MFPPVLARIIGEYAALWIIVPWVKELGFSKKEQLKYLCKNPMAMDEIDFKNISWNEFCTNPADWAVDFMLANKDKIDEFYYVAYNTNKRALQWILEESDIDELHTHIQEVLSGNPITIDYLKEHKDLIHTDYLMWNPNAKDLIVEMKIPIYYPALALNDADWAVDLLLSKDLTRCGSGLSCNSNPRIVAYLILHPNLIDWKSFSEIPTAIEYLKDNSEKVTPHIYANPNIFEPIVPIGLVELLILL